MDPELEYDGYDECIPDEQERQEVHDAFQSIILWHCAFGHILDDGIFDSNGSVLLMRGEY